jgi:hypothetical protein
MLSEDQKASDEAARAQLELKDIIDVSVETGFVRRP